VQRQQVGTILCTIFVYKIGTLMNELHNFVNSSTVNIFVIHDKYLEYLKANYFQPDGRRVQ